MGSSSSKTGSYPDLLTMAPFLARPCRSYDKNDAIDNQSYVQCEKLHAMLIYAAGYSTYGKNPFYSRTFKSMTSLDKIDTDPDEHIAEYMAPLYGSLPERIDACEQFKNLFDKLHSGEHPYAKDFRKN